MGNGGKPVEKSALKPGDLVFLILTAASMGLITSAYISGWKIHTRILVPGQKSYDKQLER